MYKIEKANKKDLEKIRKLLWSSFEKPTPYEKFQLEPWFEDFDHYRSLVIRDGDEIVSHLAIRKYENTIRGANIPLAGVAYVATEHLYRNKGMASAIMSYAFADMKKNGEVVSVLHPFNKSYYERFGYATAEILDRYLIDAKNIRRIELPPGITIRELSNPAEATKLNELQRTMSRFGSMVFFRLCELEDMIKRPNCYLFERNKEPVGWVRIRLYPVDPWRSQVVINFYAFKDDEALQAIVHLIRIYAIEYDIITEFHTENVPIMWEGMPEIPIQEFTEDRFALKLKRVGGFMIRIIDFEQYCKMITIPENATESVNMNINDRFCEWNNGTWKLTPQKGKLVIAKTSEEPDIIIDDFQLSQIISGLTPTTTLRMAGLIDCSKVVAEKLTHIFPKESFYVWNRDL